MSGDIYAAGALAYVPQTAWIPNDTVRNNVLFGKPYDQKKYDKVLEVCRLRRDLEVREGTCSWIHGTVCASSFHGMCDVYGACFACIAVGERRHARFFA